MIGFEIQFRSCIRLLVACNENMNAQQTLKHLKQRWFWVDSKKPILLSYHDVWKTKIFISTWKRWPYFNVKTTSAKKMTLFQCQNNISLSSQRGNLTSKQHSFWVDTKTNFLSGGVLFQWNYGLTACNFAKRISPC